jgi:hypothetical protein
MYRIHPVVRPPKSVAVTDKQKLGIVYLYRDAERRLQGVGYTRNAKAPLFQTIFYSVTDAAKFIDRFFTSLSRAKSPQSRAKRIKHSFCVNDILFCAPAHERAQVDWYRVAKVSPSYVWLQPICGEIHSSGSASGNASPHINTASDNPATWGFVDRVAHVEKCLATGDQVATRSGACMRWNGEPIYTAWGV